MSYQSVFKPGLFGRQGRRRHGWRLGHWRCTAHELAALGAHVVLIGRNLAKLQDVAAEIAVDGVIANTEHVGHVSFHACDIRNEEAVKTTVAAIVIAHGRIDGLVNNAGGQYITPLENISAKGWDAVVATNLTGGFLMARECYLQSMQAHGGSIVNIVADIWGSMPGMGHSGAARAGMVSFTETAALEWAKSGVRVNAVAPGYIASSGMDHYPPEAGPMLREMRETVPLGRFGNEAETSAAIVFLLSPAASFISGTVMRVDGARPQVRMGWGQVARLRTCSSAMR
jgi:citronellol/citronellal dehydrogenase